MAAGVFRNPGLNRFLAHDHSKQRLPTQVHNQPEASETGTAPHSHTNPHSYRSFSLLRCVWCLLAKAKRLRTKHRLQSLRKTFTTLKTHCRHYLSFRSNLRIEKEIAIKITLTALSKNSKEVTSKARWGCLCAGFGGRNNNNPKKFRFGTGSWTSTWVPNLG